MMRIPPLLPSCRGGARVVRTSCVRASAGTSKLRAKKSADLVLSGTKNAWFFPFFSWRMEKAVRASPGTSVCVQKVRSLHLPGLWRMVLRQSNFRFCGKRSPFPQENWFRAAKNVNGPRKCSYGVFPRLRILTIGCFLLRSLPAGWNGTPFVASFCRFPASFGAILIFQPGRPASPAGVSLMVVVREGNMRQKAASVVPEVVFCGLCAIFGGRIRRIGMKRKLRPYIRFPEGGGGAQRPRKWFAAHRPQ